MNKNYEKKKKRLNNLISDLFLLKFTLKSPFVFDDCIKWLFLDEITSFINCLGVDLVMLPIDGCLHRRKDIHDSLWNFRADTMTREQHNFLIL